jgi:hypothetical protein
MLGWIAIIIRIIAYFSLDMRVLAWENTYMSKAARS